MIPRYERTRVVQLMEFANDEWVLVCSCPFWEKHGWACRHMYKVLGRKPTVCDAHVRWHIWYGHKYGRKNDATSKKYIKLRERYAFPGVPITHERNQIRSATSVGEGDKLLAYFTNSLNKIRLCGNGGNTHWVGIRDKLPAHLKCCVPCASEEEGGGACLGNDDNTSEMGDVGCPEKSEVILWQVSLRTTIKEVQVHTWCRHNCLLGATMEDTAAENACTSRGERVL